MVKIKIPGAELELPDETNPFTLGELSKVKKIYGVSGMDLMRKDESGNDVFKGDDPDVMQGLIFTLLKRRSPLVADDLICEEVAAVGKIEFEVTGEDAELAELDPTSAGAKSIGSKRAGKSGK